MSDPVLLNFAAQPSATFNEADLGLVDAPEAEAFTAITRLAQRILRVPVVLISIVQEDKDRQFFAAQRGLPAPWARTRQTPLSHSFCQHVKDRDAPLIVADARQDPLVCDNLAVRDLDVAAYLGVPIHAPDGQPLGALCVIDNVPKAWSNTDLALLLDLARCVSDQIKLLSLMKANAQIHSRLRRYNAHRERIAMAVMTPDLSVNERFHALLCATCNALGMTTGRIARIDCDSGWILFSTLPEPIARTRQAASLSMAHLVVAGQSMKRFDTPPSHTGLRDLGGMTPGSYVAAPLVFNGGIFGVIEFTSAKPRDTAWCNEDESIVSMAAMAASAHLGQMSRERSDPIHLQLQLAGLQEARA